MSNPFQDQLLKAGIVNKKQVKKANQEKARKNKQQRSKKDIDAEANVARQKAQQVADKKAQHDRELNKRKEEQARQKAVSAEIDQLITNNTIARDESCEITYNFEHRKKVQRIHLNEEMKQQLLKRKAGIARINGRYELVPIAIAEKIQQRNAKRIILLEEEITVVAEDDPYADYQIPDDLTW